MTRHARSSSRVKATAGPPPGSGRGHRGSAGAGRTGWHLPAARHRQAAGLQRRVRGRLRHPHHPLPDLERREHGGCCKWGNWAVAKLVEALFNTSHLSDVGCTYKLLHRALAQRLLPSCGWAARTSVRS